MQSRRGVVLALSLVAATLPSCRDIGESPSDAATVDVYELPDAPPPVGSVGTTGGAVDRLVFAVFGDVRPKDLDQDALYPKTIITNIFRQMSRSYAEFAVGTGDYMFASAQPHVGIQLGDLLTSEAVFPKPVFHVLGNHECTGYTSSNCPNGTETANMQAFMTQLVPFSPTPYFAVTVSTLMGDAKFIFVAANAWSDAQDAWLRQTVATPTRYTFVIRHEPSSDNRAPGVDPSDAILSGMDVTLWLYGHNHYYDRIAPNAVISGNSGAPVSRGYYGWLLVEQRPDGNIAVRSIDQSSGRAMTSFAVDAAGRSVP